MLFCGPSETNDRQQIVMRANDMAEVTDNTAASRYEMAIDGKLAFVAYRRREGVLSLDHAEVPRELEGRGIGSALVGATLDAIRAQGLKVIPRCPFIAAFIERKPEYQDMVAD
jgi:predicted GNAT family acetyltransferase